MKLNELQLKLLNFVRESHGDQIRKYTGDPYWTHPLQVAAVVSNYDPEAIEIALCHDLFEDTECTFDKLFDKLVEIGYDLNKAVEICIGVNELTDKYTSESYPNANRLWRKNKECYRLSTISSRSQTVKYADLMENTKSILVHDKEFAKTYLEEKENILKIMDKGNNVLYMLCNSQIYFNNHKISIDGGES